MIYALAEEPEPHPDSPPDLSRDSSKSSKSSFHSSYHSDDHADMNDFEEIGLDDELHASPVDIGVKTSTLLPVMNSYTHSYAADLRSSRSLAAKKSLPALSTNLRHRDLTPTKTRSTTPGTMPPPRSATFDMSPRPLATRSTSTGPPVMRRGFSSPSTANLSTFSAMPGHRLPRSRTPSPGTIVPTDDRSRSPSVHRLARKPSWQSARERTRKTLQQLELECDEEDDDDGVPDGCILENVPISPRPRQRVPSATASKEPSPERPPPPRKDKTKAVGNGTPPVSAAQGSLRSPGVSPGVSRRGISMAQFPLNDSPRLPHRPRSWDDAMSHLSPETKALSEKLEEHATVAEHAPPAPPHRRSLGVTSTRPKVETKTRVKSTPELPPLRKTNIMIDPLPVSKEKEAVLSRTRPSWLPPKDPAEEKRHVKEYQKMMAASATSERKREEAAVTKAARKEDTAGALGKIWEEIVLPDWDNTMRHKRTRELWWRGIAPQSRGKVWSKAIGNELGLSSASFHAALARAKDAERRIEVLVSRAKKDGHDNAGLSGEELRMKISFERIVKDLDQTYPELGLFRGGQNAMEGPLHESLRDVLYAYSAYRGDVGYVPGTNGIAALLLLNLPSAPETFISLCNLLNRPLPLSFHTGDQPAMDRVYNLTIDTLAARHPRLHSHLQSLNLRPAAYLERIYRCLFTKSLLLDDAARLWDVYVFEGDAVLVRACVALLGSLEAQLHCVRDRREICSIIASGLHNNGPNANPLAFDSDEWMRRVRVAGQESGP